MYVFYHYLPVRGHSYSEGESERGETYSTDEVRSMIDADLKNPSRASKGEKHTQKIAAA